MPQQQDASARYRLVESLYQGALDIPPAERGRYLASKCEGDQELHREVEGLIDHFQSAGSSFLDRPVHGLRAAPVADNRVPTRIGPFRVIRMLGCGGMGAVFEAEQESPHRRVAIKVVRDDLYSAELQRRFRREANLLAKLPHGGIAQLFEFGAATVWYDNVERPEQLYFAMELVDGEPITQFAATRGLGLADKLHLLIQLCDAVQHAHHKGIVHRDLKPANIFVVPGGPGSESNACIKVLDFGVARVLESDAGGPTRTAGGELAGTIAYMSPEQLSEQSELIDMRSDVYSIGVVAYELLTGRLPIELNGMSLVAAIRKLAESEPPRAGSIRTELRGDVESILTKALEREPARRYASVAELSADLRRCLRHEPVTARRQSVWYLLSRFGRRHRGAVAGIAFAALALMIGSGVAVASALRATQERNRAETEAARAGLVRDFLRRMLASASPRSMHLPDVTVRQTLDEAAAQIEAGQLRAEPEVEAAVRTTIGETYLGLGRYEEALAQLEAALAIAGAPAASNSRESISLQNLIARALCGLARFDEAEQLHREAIESARELLIDDSVLASMLCDLGACLFRAGKLGDAREAHEQAVVALDRSAAPQPALRARITMELGRTLQDSGKLADAEPLLRTALALYRENLPGEHPDIAYSLNRLGWLLYRRYGNESQESEALLREALAIYRKTLDPANPELANCLNCLGMRIKIGRNPEAVALLREALRIREAALGPDNPDVAESLMHLAHALMDFDEADEAGRLCGRALAIHRRVFGENHQQYAFSLHDVAALHLSKGDAERAIPLFRESLSILVRRLGEEHDLVAHLRDSLGVGLLAIGADEEALESLEWSLAQRREVLDPAHPKIAISLANVAHARLRTGDAVGAIEAVNSCIDVLRADPGEQARYGRVLLVRAEALLEQGQTTSDAIARDIEDALEILRARHGDDSWQVANAMRVMAIDRMYRGDVEGARAVIERALAVLACVARPDTPQPRQVEDQLTLLWESLVSKE